MNFINIFSRQQSNSEDYDIVEDKKNIGENGTLQLSEDEVGDIRLVLFSHLCRDAPIDKIERLLNIYFSQITDENKEEMITDLFVIIFEKRDCRGGEGEKLLFRQLFDNARSHYGKIANDLVSVIPTYGSWMDMWQLATNENDEFTTAIIKICSEQIKLDVIASNEGRDGDITLCGKWTPSEGTKHYRRLHNIMTNYQRMINPGSTALQRDYRKTIGTLRSKSNNIERLMCAKKFAEIKPKGTPSVCALKNRKAFLNISLDKEKELDWEKGNRFPNDEDRVKCRQNWLESIAKGEIKGGQLDPMTLVKIVTSTTDKDETDLINCQWNDLVKKVRGQIAKAIEDGYDPMNNIIPMIDRSGSMSGTPELAAIGLGILLAEVCNPKFGNTVITFANNPQIIQLDPRLSFSDRVKHVIRFEAGYNTDFEKAMIKVCKIIKKKNLTQDELPALCILTDEQMNAGDMFGYSTTVDEGVKQRFIELGNEMHGIPFERPRTVHWNLRADTDGYPVQAHENNVQAITSYSASMLDLILTGKPAPTPYETMRRKIDGERYDAVREIVKRNL